MATVQDRIKFRRLEKGFTLLELAEKLGVKEATMQRYESGEIKNIKHDTIVKLAEILDCTPQYLMGWVDTPIDYNSPLNPIKGALITSFDKLNPTGQDKAVEYVSDLADNPKYQIQEEPDSYELETIAAHHETGSYSEDDLNDIEILKQKVAKMKRERK